MNKFLILLSSLFALTFFGCNNDEEELDLIDTLENGKDRYSRVPESDFHANPLS